jgi:radical SAM superfamily enzyme YgiQ (UPF0313 family)
MVLLLSTYDMGRQPFGLASPAAWLRKAGVEVRCVDLSRDRLSDQDVRAAKLIGVFLPMHTATRLAIPVIDRVRSLNPAARLCAYGLYAPLNASLLREHGITDILPGEFEQGLTELATRTGHGIAPHKDEPAGQVPGGGVPRLEFITPDRGGLPPLARYATLQIGSERRVVGYTEASRGCKHLCRHCPIVPVYNGRFRVVPIAVVVSDIRAQLAAGARHITFGDPDFFNGIGHAKAIAETFGREFPGVSYDVTMKIEHLVRHRDALPLLRDTGCALVTSAVESIDDDVLARLQKGHTRSDFEHAVALCRDAGLALAPTFVAFTPWTTIDGYCELLRTIARLDLIEHVSPIQLAIRLLVTQGSRLLELEEIRLITTAFDPRSLIYPWRHADPKVDRLQEQLSSLVGVRLSAPRRDTFAQVWTMAHEAAGQGRQPDLPLVRNRTEVPYLDEPWYC